MFKISESMKASLLIGITHTKHFEGDLNDLKAFVKEDMPPVFASLAERIFIFDPLTSSTEAGRLTRDEIIGRIQALTPVGDPRAIFEIPLTNDDRVELERMTESMAKDLQVCLDGKKYSEAATSHNHLRKLGAIELNEITKLLSRGKEVIVTHFEDTYCKPCRNHCVDHDYGAAQGVLEALEEATQYFAGVFDAQLADVREHYRASKAAYDAAQIEKEKRVRKLQAAEEATKRAEEQERENKKRAEEEERKRREDAKKIRQEALARKKKMEEER